MMRPSSLLLSMTLLCATPTVAYAADPVKMSKSGICHAPGSTYYSRTKNFSPYKTLDDCIRAGGRMPKK